jgi:hypothetical protein
MEYKTWTGSADYQRFWNEQEELDIILRTDGACTKFIGSVTEYRLRSLNAKANTVVRETLDGGAHCKKKLDCIKRDRSTN